MNKIKSIKEKLEKRAIITNEEVDELIKFIEEHMNKKRGKPEMYNKLEVLRKYIELKKQGLSDLKISETLGISYMHLWRILNGK